MLDAWQHRSDNMRCVTCMWFVEKIPSSGKGSVFHVRSEYDAPIEEPESASSIGRCRRHAPTLSGWPVVFGLDFCGDHKLDENRI